MSNDTQATQPVIGWTVDCNARPSFTELESTMEDFLKNEPVKYIFTVVSIPVIPLCVHNVYCSCRVMQFYKIMIYQNAMKKQPTSMHIQLTDATGYVKPSQLNTSQCEYFTITDPIPTSSNYEDHSNDGKGYLELRLAAH